MSSERGISSGEDLAGSNAITGDHSHIRNPTQNIYSNDNLSLALSNISTDLKILSREFTSLNHQVIALGLMRRDIDDIRQLVIKLAEAEPELRDEFTKQIVDLRGSTSFHLSALWLVVGLLMFGVALALFMAWPR